MEDSERFRRIAEEEFLERGEEWELARRWRDEGDRRARDRILAAYTRLARSYASKWSRSGMDFDELFQEAYIGLIEAVDRFDPDKGCGFSTFSRYHIISRIQLHMLNHISAVRIFNTQHTKALLSRFSRIKSEIESETGEPLDDEGRMVICRKLNIALENLKNFERAIQSPASVDVGAGVPGNETKRPLELLDGNKAPEDHVLEKRSEKNAMGVVEEALSELSDREARIMRARYIQDPPLTLDVLSREFGVSRERVRQIELRALGHLRRKLQANGINDIGMIFAE